MHFRCISDFWWGDEDGQRKVHWMSWENMTKPKGKGSIGFRGMHLFNQALLARQAWRLIHNPSSMCARVLKARCYPNGNILDTVFASDPSPVWRGVKFGLDMLKCRIIHRVGNNKTIQFMCDQWLPKDSGLRIIKLKRITRLRWVNQLISADTRCWNTQVLWSTFYDHDI